MAKQIKPLSSTQCDSAKPKAKDYSLYDGQGLILFVRKTAQKYGDLNINDLVVSKSMLALNESIVNIKESEIKGFKVILQLFGKIGSV